MNRNLKTLTPLRRAVLQRVASGVSPALRSKRTKLVPHALVLGFYLGCCS